MKRIFIFTIFILILFFGLFIWQFLIFSDRNLHIVFCDVGQGDAILITTPSGQQILFDGGPDEHVLSCLSKHTPFWDRTIELIILSHPHADHLNGLINVIDRYTLKYFITEPLVNKTAGYNALQHKLHDAKIRKKEMIVGEKMRFEDGVSLEVVGPSQAYIDRTSPKGTIGERAEFASLIIRLSYRDFDMLLTGDSQVSGLNDALLQGATLQHEIEVLQVPHHGSKYGLDKQLVEMIDPQLAVISVGKNSYGHPSPAIISLLQAAEIMYFRTDRDGAVEMVSDGKRFWVKE